MLQSIRDNAQGTIAKIIVGLIILTFAIFGTDAIIQSFYGEPVAAEVNGQEITQAEFERTLERKRRQLIAQMGNDFDPAAIDQNQLRKTTLDEAVRLQVLVQAAESAGLFVSEQQIDAFILQWSAAQVDGQFNQDQFRLILGSLGMTPMEFRRELAKEMLIGQLQSGIQQTAFVTPAEIGQLLKLERQTRDYHYRVFEAAKIRDEMEVSEAEIQEYYESRQEDFRLPDRVVVDYVELSREDLTAGVQVADDEVRAQFESEIAGFEASEQRRASHLLLEIPEGGDEEGVRNRLLEIRARIEGGLDFAEAARSESEDIGTAADGGSLGLLSRGNMGDDAFDQVLFSLAEGQLSDPVRTRFGYHLIRLEAVVSTRAPSFEEAAPRIRGELQARKAEDLFVEQSTRLADLTYSSADLSEAIAEMQLEQKQSPAFSRSGGDGLWSNPRILEQAFSEDVLNEGHNSDVIEISRDRVVVLRKNTFLPSEVQALEAVRERIRETVALEKAKQRLKADVDQAVAAAAQETPPGEDWVAKTGISRTQMQGDEGRIVRWAFTMPRPGSDEEVVVRSFETEDGFVVIALNQVTDPDSAGSEGAAGFLEPFMASRAGTGEFALYEQILQESAEIVR